MRSFFKRQKEVFYTMVDKEEYKGETVYHCEVCGFHYRDRELAEQCETHCRDHNSCSDEITAKSIERTG